MAVRVVTDSTSDIPAPLAEALGITVVPVYVRFGDAVYRDRVDISEDELYRRLVEGPVHPATSTPSPGDFGEVFTRLAAATDEIVCVMLTSKESGTHNSAVLAQQMFRGDCHIEVIDSESISMGIGLIAMAAARAAQAGQSLDRVAAVARDAISKTHMYGVLDTLRYLERGARIGRVRALLGTVLNAKPLLTVRDGQLMPLSVVRTRARAIERLERFVVEAKGIGELAVVYNTTPDEVRTIAERAECLAHVPPIIARLGPALGVHADPGFLGVGFREA